MKSSSNSNTSAYVQQPQTALIRRKEVERLTALSRSRIYDLMKQGTFPKPVRLGAMSVAWEENLVRNWIADRIADSRKTAEA
ncbi:MAG: AlpA family transcriptional regulator [Candidatus Nitrotoga sp.]|nr:AlpA family transcriptional regulator [Candidatus Nitrotoga sp.]MDP1856999.1 AlpA family transcriptional regulator [Candidatus Nitrotoga sp.]